MSASREKKMRKQDTGSVSAASQAKNEKNIGKKVWTAVIVIAVIAIVAFFTLINTGFFEATRTAATVGNRNLSAAEVNYWLVDTYSQEQSSMSYLVDEELPLSEQEFPEEGFDNWYDYMLDLALKTAANSYTVYDEAMEAGFELSTEAKDNLKSQLDTLDVYGSMYGYSNGTSYLTAMYGPGSRMSSYKDYMTVNLVAQEYSAAKIGDVEYTKEELDAYYAENSEKVDLISYRFFEISAEAETAEDGTTTVTEEALQAASEKAIAVAEAAKGSEEAFLEQVLATMPEDQLEGFDVDAATLAPNATAENAPEALRNWLTETKREAGEVFIFENDAATGYYVIYFLGYVDMDISLPSVRHILIQPEADEEGNKSEEAWAAAKDKADALLAEYLAGEQTEEAFAALADSNTSDTGSTGNGGLYENIAPGQMVPAFNDWCFSPHDIGDTDVIETDYGYHVMYFCGESLNTYRDIATETAKKNSEYASWQEDIEADASYAVVSSKDLLVF